MLIIPLQPLPSQTVQTILPPQQAVKLSVYQKNTGMFIDVYVNDALIIGGVICENMNVIVRSTYLGFIGDLAFFDTTPEGADPFYSGLGSRWQLAYLSPSELPAGVQ